MFSELSITIKDDDKRLTKKFLQYEPFQVDENDPVIKSRIKETLENFDGEPTDVKVTIIMEL